VANTLHDSTNTTKQPSTECTCGNGRVYIGCPQHGSTLELDRRVSASGFKLASSTPSCEELEALHPLADCQLEALQHVRRTAKWAHKSALTKLRQRVVKLGFNEASLHETLSWIRERAPILIHVNLNKVLEKLERDTHYRNQFETKTSGGTLNEKKRQDWERHMFGSAYDQALGSQRPKYGTLNLINDPQGIASCSAYGKSYMILRNVRLRTTFTALDSSAKPDEVASCDYYAHVLAKYTDEELKATLQVGGGVLPSVKSQALKTYKEVQIHGDVHLSQHVATMVVHPESEHHKARLGKLAAAHGFDVVYMKC